MSEVVQIPSLLQEYRLVEEAFRGPATVAWRAEHLKSGLTARVTMVASPPRASREAIDAISQAFRRSLERAGAMSLPDLLPFDGAAEHEGMPCAVTILPEGTLLSDAMALEEPVSVPRVMQIGSVIGHALARLHDAGLWHGFLHPANILLVGDERPALLDPLIHAAPAAAAWQAGLQVTGSAYVGVGERAFRDQDPYVDVYALAAILLRIMTGSSPERMLMEQIERRLPQALPTSLRQDLLSALNIGEQSRPPTARTLAVHLSFDVAWLRATAELGAPAEGSPGAAPDADRPAARVTEEAPEAGSVSSPPVPRTDRPALRSPLAEPPGVGDAPPEAPPQTALEVARPAPSTSPRPVAPSPGRQVAPSPGRQVAPSPTPAPSWTVPPPAPPRASFPHWPLVLATLAVVILACVPIGYILGRSRPTAPVSRVAPERQALVYRVQLGPYPDRASASLVQERIARAWPGVWVFLENGQGYVQVLETVYADRAQRALRQLQEKGYQGRVRTGTRSYSPLTDD